MPCIREYWTEDNDTEEESEEEETEGNSKMLEMMSNMLADRKATMKDLKKGFVFFMEQEKKDIQRYARIERALKMAKKTEEITEEEAKGPPVRQWWEDEQYFRPITEWTLQKNEWLPNDMSAEDMPPYEAEAFDPENPDPSDRLNSEETDEEFDWFQPDEHNDDTYFHLVNKNRKRFETGD